MKPKCISSSSNLQENSTEKDVDIIYLHFTKAFDKKPHLKLVKKHFGGMVSAEKYTVGSKNSRQTGHK